MNHHQRQKRARVPETKTPTTPPALKHPLPVKFRRNDGEVCWLAASAVSVPTAKAVPEEVGHGA